MSSSADAGPLPSLAPVPPTSDEIDAISRTYPYQGESPTTWLHTYIPTLEHFIFRRGRANKDGTQVWYFQCAFGGRDRSTKYKTKRSKYHCDANFTVRVVHDSATISFAYLDHTHETGDQNNAAWFRPGKVICDAIAKMTRKGYTPAHIRKKLRLTIPAQMFYAIRRPILAQARGECNAQLLAVIEEMTKRWKVVRHFSEDDETNDILALSFISHRFRGVPIALDVIQMDDILCTSIGDHVIINLCVKDENGQCQLVAFGVTSGRTQEDFATFLDDVRKYHGIPRVIIADRCAQQADAIEQVFPETTIVFCRVHVRRCIEQNIHIPAVLRAFDQLMSEQIRAAEFEEILVAETEHRDDVTQQRIRNLIRDLPRYAPEFIKHLRLREQYTTNVVEGFHGNVRGLLESKQDISGVLTCFDQQHEELIVRSFREFASISPEIYDGLGLGTQAVEILRREYATARSLYDRIVDGRATDEDRCMLGECRCNVSYEYGLPCWHNLFEQIESHQVLHEVPDVYLRTRGPVLAPSEQVVVDQLHRPKEDKIQWTYSKLIRRFEHIAGIAVRNEAVRDAITRLFNELKDIRTPGARISRPAAMVASGRQRTKRNYTCGYCHERGHNRKRVLLQSNRCS